MRYFLVLAYFSSSCLYFLLVLGLLKFHHAKFHGCKQCRYFVNSLWIWNWPTQHQNLQLCGFRKYPYPHHRGNWKFRRGGGSKTQEIPEGRGGCMMDLVSRGPLIQYGFECRSSCSKILSYLLSRTFTWKRVAWILVFDSHYIWNAFSFFKKHFGS